MFYIFSNSIIDTIDYIKYSINKRKTKKSNNSKKQNTEDDNQKLNDR